MRILLRLNKSVVYPPFESRKKRGREHTLSSPSTFQLHRSRVHEISRSLSQSIPLGENQSATPRKTLLHPATRSHACQYRVGTLVRSRPLSFLPAFLLFSSLAGPNSFRKMDSTLVVPTSDDPPCL